MTPKRRSSPRRARLITFLCLAGICAAPAAGQERCSPSSVVRADAGALSTGDPERILALFKEDATVFSLPKDPASLVGPVSAKLGTQEQRRATFRAFAGGTPDSTEVVDVVEVGDLAVAKLRITSAQTGAATLFLAGYRISNCRIVALWHIGRSDAAQDGADAEAVVRELVSANNAGRLAAFLDSFSPAVLHFRSSGDPRAIGDKPSRWNGDPEGRRRLYAAMFAKGAPVQVSAHIFSVGDLVVSRDIARGPDGNTTDEISVYRVSQGRITHDWLIAELKP